mmetsp:Transcript_19311/g.48319  ORF Transcript_19311/g.48319 Transcript_19311/m.48319 type:complete len:100 (-) Transcript_19311:606-905(-)
MRLLVLFLGALVASVRAMPARTVRRVSSARLATDPTRNEAHHEAADVDVLDVLDRAVTPFERKDSIILLLTVAKLREQPVQETRPAHWRDQGRAAGSVA